MMPLGASEPPYATLLTYLGSQVSVPTEFSKLTASELGNTGYLPLEFARGNFQRTEKELK